MQDALEEVAFENVGLSIAACRALSELLGKPGALRVLQFRNNMSDDDGAMALAQVALLSIIAVFSCASCQGVACAGP